METHGEIHRLVVERIEKLPPMPQTVAEVMRMGDGEDVSAVVVADVVCKDPTLAARVLKLCNSGFYGRSQEILSVRHAILLLGFSMVRNLVFSSFVHACIQGDLGGYDHSCASLWEHSFGTATACHALAEETAPDLADAAYAAGLIHDIGKVVLASFLAKQFEAVCSLVETGSKSFEEAENHVLGTSHSEVGALVAKHWQLPTTLFDVVRHHHSPRRVTDNPRLCALVNLADSACDILGIGTGLDGADASFNEWSLRLLHLDEEQLQAATDKVTRRLFDLRGTDVFSGN